MSRTQKYLLSGLLCLLLCLGGYLLYQRQQLKAPATSLTMTQTAVTNHDWLGANEHMDLEALYAQAFDEIVVPSLQKRNNGVISAVARDILHRMRGIFVDTMVDYTNYQLVFYDFLDSGSCGSKILTRIEVSRVLGQILSDRSGERHSEVGVDIDFAN